MKFGDRVEGCGSRDSRFYKKRGTVISMSDALVVIKLDGEDFHFSLLHKDVRVLSAVEHLAEKAE